MKPLLIQQTNSTLGVTFDPGEGTLAMRGESYPEDALKFFTPVLEWLNNYFDALAPEHSVTVDLDIVYFNSSSSKALMKTFDLFEKTAKRGVDVNIVWHYHEENEVAEECGEEFGEELLTANFSMRPYGDES